MGTNENCYYLSMPAEIVHGARRLGRAADRFLLKAVSLLQLWTERAAQRRQLAELDARMLKDIGIGRADAERESGKWFWQD